MRVLFVVHGYPPRDILGTEVHARAVADVLSARGHDVRVFSGGSADRSRGRSVTDESQGAVAVRRVEAPPDRTGLRLLDPWVRAEFERLLDEARPDVVHVQHLLHLSGDLIEAARHRSVSTVVTLHDFWFQCPAIHPGPRVRHPLAGRAWGMACLWHHWLRPRRVASVALRGGFPAGGVGPARRAGILRRQLAMADAVLAPSRFVHEAFLRFGVESGKLWLLPHGIHVSPVPATPPGDGPVRFGFVGALARRKGVHILCRAFRSLGGDSTLHLHGPVDSPSYFRRMARSFGSRIRYEGPFHPDDAGTVYSTFDVLVAPAIVGEPYGLTIDEAQAYGLPVIASRIGAPPERIRHGRDGILVPPGDVHALRQALASLTDPAAVRELAAEVRPPRSMAAHAQRLEAIYAGLASSGAPNLVVRA